MSELSKASLVVLTRNAIGYTRMCIDSIFKNTDKSFELIVLDQASTDGTVDYLEELRRERTNVKIITNERNIGFAAGNNRAAQLASGSIIVFLNNDVIVTPSWLEDLVQPLTRDPELAATGPTSNATGELQLDSYSIGRIRKIPEDIESYAAAKRQLMAGRIWNFHRLAGFCLAIKKEVFHEVGGFSEQLTFFEDDHLCRRILQKGHKLAIIPSVFIYHFGSSTFKAFSLNVDTLMQINRAKFLQEVVCHRAKKLTQFPKVSVITTTFNRPQELETAVRSIRTQTYPNWEAIVVNDGGQNVGHVIEDQHDQRLKYVDSKHLGRPGALNLALQNATGEYIAYLDDDDTWYPDHLQLCVEFLERNRQIGLVYTKAVRKEYRRNTNGTKTCVNERIDHQMEFDRLRLLDTNWIPNVSVVHRRSLLQQVPAFSDLPVLEDYDFWLRLSSVTEFAHLAAVTGEYYVDRGRESRNEQLRQMNPKLYFEILNQITSTQRACVTSEASRIAGQCFWDNGDSAQALKMADRSLQANPLNYLALRLFCLAALKDRDSDRRLSPRLERFLRARPDRSDIWKWYASELIKREQYVKALRALEMALTTRQTESEAGGLYQLMSLCYLKLGIEDTAVACTLRSRQIETGSLPSPNSGDELPVLPEGAILDQWFERGILATPLKGLSYYYLYSRRWGHRAAMRKIAGGIATHHKKMR